MRRRGVLVGLLLCLLGTPTAAAACLNALFVTDIENPDGGPAPYEFEVWFDCTTNGEGHAYSAVVEGPGTSTDFGPVYDQWQGGGCDDSHSFVLEEPGEYFVTLRCDGDIEQTRFFEVTGNGPGPFPQGMGTFLAFLAIVAVAVAVAIAAQKRKKKRGPAVPPAGPAMAAPAPPAPPPAPGWVEVGDAAGRSSAARPPFQQVADVCTLEADRTLACPNQHVKFTVRALQPLASVTWKAGTRTGRAAPHGNQTTFTVAFPAPEGREPEAAEVSAECRLADGSVHHPTAAVRVRALSGPAWVGAFGFDNDPASLAPPFRDGFLRFKADLEAAGARCRVTSAYRDARRQYLMWGSSIIVRQRASATSVEEDPRGNEGVDICWCHRNKSGEPSPGAAHAAARALTDLFGGLRWGAQRKGNHPLRVAADMQVHWTGALQLPGLPPIVSEPRDESNADLQQAARRYGVVHFIPKVGRDGRPRDDPVHWSWDGA